MGHERRVGEQGTKEHGTGPKLKSFSARVFVPRSLFLVPGSLLDAVEDGDVDGDLELTGLDGRGRVGSAGARAASANGCGATVWCVSLIEMGLPRSTPACFAS